MFFKKFWIVPFFILILTFLSCGKNSSLPLEKPKVIVSLSPYNTFVQAIAGNTLDVVVAIPPGFDPHIFEATPKQMLLLKDASLWFGIQEPSEKKIFTSLKRHEPSLEYVDLSQNIIPLHDTSDSCGHHHDSTDRHYWMSPMIVKKQLTLIKEALIQLKPEYTAMYEANAENYAKELDAINAWIHQELAHDKSSAILVSHPSMGYYCHEYGLQQLSIECEGKSPLPKQLQALLLKAKQTSVKCLFTQKQFDNKGALLIAKQLNLPVYELDPHNSHYIENLKTITLQIENNES